MFNAVADKGVRVGGPLIILTAVGAANTGNLWQMSNFAQMVGVKTAKIKRLKVNKYGGGGNAWLYIGSGTGGGFVQLMPRLRVLDMFNDDYDEDDLPNVIFTATITCYVDVATVEVQAEIEEIG